VVSCGPGGADRAVVDAADQVAADCETVEYADSDGDGFDTRSDCNDANPAIKPGATDAPGNGVDEDCSGGDAAFPDADGDGVDTRTDCNDGNAAIKPGATDVPGNGVDEDCSGADATASPGGPGGGGAAPVVPAEVQHRWALGTTFSRVLQLTISKAPAGAKVTVRCKGRGCAFRVRSASFRRGRAQLARFFKRRNLRRGTVVEVVISAPGFTSKVVRYTVRGRRKLPRSQRLCQPAGATAPQACS
jgi:hypothetical protein